MWFHNSDRIFNSVGFTKKISAFYHVPAWRYMHSKKWVQFQQRYIRRRSKIVFIEYIHNATNSVHSIEFKEIPYKSKYIIFLQRF